MRSLVVAITCFTFCSAAFAQEKPKEAAPDAPPSAEATPAEATAPDSTAPDSAAPDSATAPGSTAAGDESDADAPPGATQENQPVGDADAPQDAVEPPADEGRKSASANQATQIPDDDDYSGATDDALVEPGKRTKDLSLGIALDLTWPLGSAANYIGSASIQGLSLDLRYYAWGNIGVGVGVALDSLSKKTNTTVEWENATITGTQVREINFTPLLAKGYYAWRDQERFVPYVALGLGAARTVRRLIVGFSSLSDASWHFAAVPEAGLQIPAGPTVILTNLRLNYLPPAAGIDEQVFVNFSVGLSIQ